MQLSEVCGQRGVSRTEVTNIREKVLLSTLPVSVCLPERHSPTAPPKRGGGKEDEKSERKNPREDPRGHLRAIKRRDRLRKQMWRSEEMFVRKKRGHSEEKYFTDEKI